jgi:hypothetical protein
MTQDNSEIREYVEKKSEQMKSSVMFGRIKALVDTWNHEERGKSKVAIGALLGFVALVGILFLAGPLLPRGYSILVLLVGICIWIGFVAVLMIKHLGKRRTGFKRNLTSGGADGRPVLMQGPVPGRSRVVLGYVVAPLAASLAAALILVVQDAQTISYLMRTIVTLYVAAFALGAPVCFVIRLLPTRSLIVYILCGVAVGAIIAPAIQSYSDLFSHGHQLPAVASLVWQATRSALAGAVGLGVFWFIVVETQ